MALDKKKALESALGQIEKQFGKGAVMRLGQSQTMQVDAIPTGSLIIPLFKSARIGQKMSAVPKCDTFRKCYIFGHITKIVPCSFSLISVQFIYCTACRLRYFGVKK